MYPLCTKEGQCARACVCVCQEDRRRIPSKSNQLRNCAIGFGAHRRGPQRQHFHTDITCATQALFQPLQTVFHCGGVTACQAGICCPPFPKPQQKNRREMETRVGLGGVGGFFCTNYLMCDLRARLPVMRGRWFILSFNLSSNLFRHCRAGVTAVNSKTRQFH